MTAPFTGLGEAGVNARVAIAILRRLCKDRAIRELSPSITIGLATSDLSGLQFKTLRSAFMSLNVWCLDKRKSSDWLTGVIYRDMMGYSIRRCFFDAYKEHRRDPRVTNRGVTRRALRQQDDVTSEMLRDTSQVSNED